MDFSQIPDLILKRIIYFLPIEDQFRLSRIDQRFRSLSINVLEETEFLDIKFPLGENPRRKLCLKRFTPHDLRNLLQLCSRNLKSLEVESYGDRESRREFASIFGHFEYPNLTHLDLATLDLDSTTFFSVLIRSPNLRTLIRKSSNSFEFPNVVTPNLETFIVNNRSNDEFYTSLFNRMPKLIVFNTDMCFAQGRIVDDMFFASVPHLETLEMEFPAFQNENPSTRCDFDETMHYFWRLEHLKELRLHRLQLSNHDLLKIDLNSVTLAFQNLIRLDLSMISIQNHELDFMAQYGVPKLEEIKLNIAEKFDYQFDSGIQKFSKIPSLKTIKFPKNSVRDTTFRDFIRLCPNLTTIWFGCIRNLIDEQMVKLIRDTVSQNVHGRRNMDWVFMLNSSAATQQPLDTAARVVRYHKWFVSKEGRDWMKSLKENEGLTLSVQLPNLV